MIYLLLRFIDFLKKFRKIFQTPVKVLKIFEVKKLFGFAFLNVTNSIIICTKY